MNRKDEELNWILSSQWVWLTEIRLLPDRPGLYAALSWNNEVLYVGRARSLRDRWRFHHRFDQLSRFNNVRIFWIPAPPLDEWDKNWEDVILKDCDPNDPCIVDGRFSTEKWLDLAERKAIAVLKPPLNNAAMLEHWECANCGFKHG